MMKLEVAVNTETAVCLTASRLAGRLWAHVLISSSFHFCMFVGGNIHLQDQMRRCMD